MTKFLSILAIVAFLHSTSFGEEVASYKMYSEQQKSYQDVKSVTKFGSRLAEQCFTDKKKPKCLALVAFDSKVPPNQAYASKINLAGNPAARFCYSFDSVNRIFKDKNGADYDFCLFKDGSFVDAWDLYKKHHKKEK